MSTPRSLRNKTLFIKRMRSNPDYIRRTTLNTTRKKQNAIKLFEKCTETKKTQCLDDGDIDESIQKKLNPDYFGIYVATLAGLKGNPHFQQIKKNINSKIMSGNFPETREPKSLNNLLHILNTHDTSDITISIPRSKSHSHSLLPLPSPSSVNLPPRPPSVNSTPKSTPGKKQASLTTNTTQKKGLFSNLISRILTGKGGKKRTINKKK